MRHIQLDGQWELFGFPEDSRKVQKPSELDECGVAAIPASVPGNVELDLARAGLIPEPFQGTNIFLLRPYEQYEWWYKRTVELPAQAEEAQWRLVFEGLDTLAEIWINDQLAGSARNMLTAHALDATPFLRWGETNTIAVHLRSVLREAARQAYEPLEMSWEHRFEGLMIRKAAHTWGWDIMPRAVSAGIWRPVTLEEVPADRFDWVYYWTRQASSQGAVLGVHFQFHLQEPLLDGLRVRFEGECEGQRFQQDWPVEFTADRCSIYVPNPKLWWPKGSGPASLYTLTASLYRGETLLAQNTQRVGLRTVEVDFTSTASPFVEREALQSSPARWDQPGDPEHHFLIRVNGEPILIKGTNWVPLDAFHSRDAERLPRVFELVRESGVNMIRCWGGNVYESDRFYDLCDENGVLVWQDLAFACAAYPQKESFFEEVRAELSQVTARLRNHACLALWCGDNENDMLYLAEGLDPNDNRLTREVIPQMLRRCDPHRAYIPSSPYYSPAALREKSVTTPEQHLWGPRGYYKSSFYTHHNAHFIGEIGYHGCPNPDSIAKFISPEALWPWQGNPEWLAHSVNHWQVNPEGRDRIQLMANQVLELFGSIPENLEAFALASQITQAEAKKFFVESTRLRKWRTSGVIWWNLIDGWPQFSDAVVDYYFGRKLAFDVLRRVQVPVCLIIGEAGPGKYLPLVACNDTLSEAAVQFRAWDADTQETLAEGQATLPPNQNWQVGRIRVHASDQRMILMEWESEGQRHGNHYLSGTPPFQLERYLKWLRQVASLPSPIDLSHFQTIV